MLEGWRVWVPEVKCKAEPMRGRVIHRREVGSRWGDWMVFVLGSGGCWVVHGSSSRASSSRHWTHWTCNIEAKPWRQVAEKSGPSCTRRLQLLVG